MNRLFLSLFLCLVAVGLSAEDAVRYRVWLKGKDMTTPIAEVLSTKSLQRRTAQGVSLTESDRPLAAENVAAVLGVGVREVVRSRWMNTLTVGAPSSVLLSVLLALPCVDSVECVWIAPTKPATARATVDKFTSEPTFAYGDAKAQLSIHQGDRMHQVGYRGEGMTIAVIDAGFFQADKTIDTRKIIGTRDFVTPGGDVFREDAHGARVLSALAGEQHNFIGSAPDARYLLLRSENVATELPIEEDYLVAAMEYADSLGVDMITSSLGYTVYDAPFASYTPRQLDGKHAFVSLAADKTLDKGIVMLASAGNDYATFKYIGCPGDAQQVLTVGAMTPAGVVASFSSAGNAANGYVKPDVVGIGAPAALINTDGSVFSAQGTSYATPVVAGVVACLWQAMPGYTAREVMHLVRRYSTRYSTPDYRYGYGAPKLFDAWVATSLSSPDAATSAYVADGYLYLPAACRRGQLFLYGSDGSILHQLLLSDETVLPLPPLSSGFYLLHIVTPEQHIVLPIVR